MCGLILLWILSLIYFLKYSSDSSVLLNTALSCYNLRKVGAGRESQVNLKSINVHEKGFIMHLGEHEKVLNAYV